MKNLYIILLFLFYSTFTFAQKDFRKGYIVQNADTVRGYVDYRGDNRSAQTTTFKSTLNGEEQKYSPDNIAGYGFENEKKAYESKLVTVSYQGVTEKVQLFLNILVKGKASIYYYRDNYSADHYFLQKDTLLTELENNKSLVTDSKTETKYERYDKRYIGILNYAFSDCQSISESQLNKVRFNHSDLIRITAKYNECITPDAANTTFTNREEKLKMTFGLVLVYTQANLKFKSAAPLGQATFQNDSHLGAGISVNLVMPSLHEKLTFQTELLYIPAKFSSPRTLYGPYYYDFLFDLAYIKLPAQLRYTYPKGKVRPFINAGYMAGYAIKDTNQRTVVHKSLYPGPSTSEAIAENGFTHEMYGFTAGAGLTCPVRNNALSLELRYDRNSGVSKLGSLGSSINSFNLFLSYGL